MAFPQTIMGKWGWENETSTSQKHKLGTKMQIADCTFVYASAGEGVTVGQLMESSAVEGNENDDLAVATGGGWGYIVVRVTFGGAVNAGRVQGRVPLREHGHSVRWLPVPDQGQCRRHFCGKM